MSWLNCYTSEMLPPSKFMTVLQSGSHLVSRPKTDMNNLPAGPGKPGTPGKLSFPGRPAAPIVVWPGFPLFPFRPGTSWGPRAPGTPEKIRPHQNANYMTLLTLQGYSIQWHTLETRLQGKTLGKYSLFSIRVRRVLRHHLA